MKQRTFAFGLMCLALGLGALSSCSSQADKERQEAIEKQKDYDRQFKAKEKAILDAQGKGSSEAMENWRFPDTSKSKSAERKLSEQK